MSIQSIRPDCPKIKLFRYGCGWSAERLQLRQRRGVFRRARRIVDGGQQRFDELQRFRPEREDDLQRIQNGVQFMFGVLLSIG